MSPEGLERLKRLGARRIAVFSYFLFTGVLEERIRHGSEEFAAANPEVYVSYAGYFGPARKGRGPTYGAISRGRTRDIRMNLHVLRHTSRPPGFEEKVGAPATPHYHPRRDGPCPRPPSPLGGEGDTRGSDRGTRGGGTAAR
jgi:sirohydrochlorin cobaltochelatase